MPKYTKHQSWFRRALLVLCAAFTIAALLPPVPAYAVAEGDGIFVYSEQFTVSTPFREYTDSGGTWTAKSNMSTGDASFAVRFTKTLGSPTESEMIAVHSNSNGAYRVHRWSGSAWTFEWTDSGAGSSGSAFIPRFDFAYDNAGNAVVFYSGNVTSNEISYQVYTNATNSWSGEQFLSSGNTSAAVRDIAVENRPGTDEFVIVWNDDNMDLSGQYYDLSADTFYGEPSSAFTTSLSTVGTNAGPRSRMFDVAIESSSDEVLVCWSEDLVSDLKCKPRTVGTGGSWGTTTTYTTYSHEPLDMKMAADPDPSSNKIAVASFDTAVQAAIWDGSAWGNHTVLDSSVDTMDTITTNVAVEWVRSGSTSEAVVTYDDANSSGTDWATYNPGSTTWTVETDNTTAFAAASSNDKFHRIVRNPLDSDELCSIVIDGNFDVSMKKIVFDGSNYTWSSMDDSGATLNNNQPSQGGWTGTFAFYAFAGAPPVLSVDIVDSGGSSVTSPSVTMSAVSSGNTCQTPTGTLGTSSEKIRVTNTTATPGWSLTVAASGGATANWSASTSTYDFNDSGTSGCIDSGDTDTIGGQLTMDASGGTVTAQSGCNTTGITKGSSTAFVEGTTNAITILSASGSAGTGCYWDLTSVSLSQKIPSYQLPGSYTIQLTLTVTAN